jgi:hypothetical protein
MQGRDDLNEGKMRVTVHPGSVSFNGQISEGPDSIRKREATALEMRRSGR